MTVHVVIAFDCSHLDQAWPHSCYVVFTLMLYIPILRHLVTKQKAVQCQTFQERFESLLVLLISLNLRSKLAIQFSYFLQPRTDY